MRRLASAMLLGVLVAGLVAAPALARANKVALVGYAPNGVTQGGGSVIFNNPSGRNNLQVTVQLKGARPNFTYAVYLFVDGAWYRGAPVGSITTDGQGNATFHKNAKVSAGQHLLAIAVALPGSGSDQYLAPAYVGMPWGIHMTFKK